MESDDKPIDTAALPSANEPPGSQVHNPDHHKPGEEVRVGEVLEDVDPTVSSGDPDDIEDEIEQEIDDGDIEPKPKKRKR